MASKRFATGLTALPMVAALCVGCATTVAGNARRGHGTVDAPPQALVDILPTEHELSSSVGNPLHMNGFPPRSGGIELLPNGIRTNADASPIECVGATSALMRLVYESASVRAVATADFWNYDFDAAASSANVGAVRFASADDAQALFTTFTQQWRGCEGTTVAGHTNNGELYSRVEHVELSGPVLSATIVAWDDHHTPEFPNERAIGIKSNVIVEADVAVTKPRAKADGRAVNVVDVMLDKIADVG